MTIEIKWTEDLIIAELKRMIADRKLDYVPSIREMDAYFGSSMFSNQVRKRGMISELPELLNLPKKMKSYTKINALKSNKPKVSKLPMPSYVKQNLERFGNCYVGKSTFKKFKTADGMKEAVMIFCGIDVSVQILSGKDAILVRQV